MNRESTEPHIHYPSESMVQPSAGSSLAYLRHPQQKWSEICLVFSLQPCSSRSTQNQPFPSHSCTNVRSPTVPYRPQKAGGSPKRVQVAKQTKALQSMQWRGCSWDPCRPGLLDWDLQDHQFTQTVWVYSNVGIFVISMSFFEGRGEPVRLF